MTILNINGNTAALLFKVMYYDIYSQWQYHFHLERSNIHYLIHPKIQISVHLGQNTSMIRRQVEALHIWCHCQVWETAMRTF